MNLAVAFSQLIMAALFFMGISYLWRGNVAFSAVMQLIVALLAAQNGLASLIALNSGVIAPLVGGSLIELIYIIVSILLFFALFDKWRWIARYPTAILAGTGLGLCLRNILWTDVVGQINSTILPLTGVLIDDFSNVFFVIALVLSLFYFMFGFELKGPWVTINKVARFVVIFGLGVQAGATFFTSSLLGQQQFYQVKTYFQIFWENIH